MGNIKEEKVFKIAGITIWRLLVYFAIYSVAGYIIETIFGILTKGLLESRKGFLYGPFCPIYGVGAVVMILALQPFKKNNYTLFLGGFLVGSIVEYIISFLGEVIFNVNWWDYSNNFLNVNGRICFTFSLFWGLLAIYLIKHFNPIIDKMMNSLKQKISIKLIKKCIIIISIFLFIDFILTGLALKLFFARTVYSYNLDVSNKEKYIVEYENLMQHEKILNIGNTIFSNKKMIKTFPNLKLKATSGGIIYMNSIYNDIQPYYYKFNF
ncbi:MAG: putative ABC transporter permease [Clostridia bacterium]|nr:putative ABC transporter permease [Clostridia bacterium]